jgi:hypothetical protein
MNSVQKISSLWWEIPVLDKNANIAGKFIRHDTDSRMQARTSKDYTTFVKPLYLPQVGDSHNVKGLGRVKVVSVVKSSGDYSATLETQIFSNILVEALTRGRREERIWLWDFDSAWNYVRRNNAFKSASPTLEWLDPGERDSEYEKARSKRTERNW